MARKAAQKAAQASPLDSCAIAISGTFPGTNQSAIQERITNLGATIAKSVTSDTTLLIATVKDVEKGSVKVKAATANDVPIVSIDWLEDCESTNSKADEQSYLLTSSAPVSNVPQSNNSKKRAASPDLSPPPAPATAQPPKKQLKLADSKPVAQVGDGQNAKSSALRIPLDEYCPLASSQVYFGDDGTIFDASLNQTNATANNNKFYRVQVRLGLVCNLFEFF